MTETIAQQDLYLEHKTKIKAAKQAAKILRDIPETKRVILFGSVAKNTDNSKSDVDLIATYTGVPSASTDTNFHSTVIKLIEGKGIILGNPENSKEKNSAKITIQTMSDVVLTYPELFINPFDLTILSLVKNVNTDGLTLFSRRLWGEAAIRDKILQIGLKTVISQLGLKQE